MPSTVEKALGSSTEYGSAGLDGARSSSIVNKAEHPASEAATNSTEADRMVVGVVVGTNNWIKTEQQVN